MKKQLKRIMALMLSLVMLLGCMPCFNNEASAETFQPKIKIEFNNLANDKRIYVISIGNLLFCKDLYEYSWSNISTFNDNISFSIANKRNLSESLGESDDLSSDAEYQVKIVASDATGFSHESDSLGNFEGFDDTTIFDIQGVSDWCIKNATCTINDNTATIIFDLCIPESIEKIKILDEREFNSLDVYFKTPEDANYTIAKAKTDKWYTNKELTSQATSFSNDSNYYTELIITPKDGYEFEESPKITIDSGYVYAWQSYTKSSITIRIAKTAKVNQTFNVEHMNIQSKEELINLALEFKKAEMDLAVAKVNSKIENSTISCIPMPMGLLSSKYIGKYILEISETASFKPSESIDVPCEIAGVNKVILNGTEYSFETQIENLTDEEEMDYVLRKRIMAYKNLTADKDSNSKTKAPYVQIYEVYDFSRNEGTINFTGINPEKKILDVIPTGDLSSFIDELKIYELNEGIWGEPINSDTAIFDKDKQYKINCKISSPYDYKQTRINGIDAEYELSRNSSRDPISYPETTGIKYTYDNDDLGFIMYMTYIFTPQNPSSGSKKYKANDNDSAEKISGSGKKGSKRTITPEEGRKVTSVIVTDKDGNKVDVTMNEDGTYSFIQPASNVNVEVIYKNREITLTIGSTLADVDGEKSNLDVCPITRKDRTMLPIRFVAENLGAKVEWNEKRPDYVVIERGDIKIEITLGKDIMLVNDKEVKLDTVAFAENDRTYLPVRAISEALNAIVEWNEEKPNEVKIFER